MMRRGTRFFLPFARDKKPRDLGWGSQAISAQRSLGRSGSAIANQRLGEAYPDQPSLT
jgi:hypothetical protein